MSFKAKRLTNPGSVVSFAWDGGRTTSPAHTPAPAAAPAENAEAPRPQIPLAAIERDAFAKGFATGEQAGLDAASDRIEAMIRRLTQTIEELVTLRASMIRQTERQMVELSLAVARRIIHREVSLDRDLLIAMARVALDRLGESAQVTVRLHPEDYELTGAARVTKAMGRNVTVVADPNIERGGCLVESDLGSLDAGVDSQIQEFARALLAADYDEPESIRNAA
jgi:flagellar assembly protein FliH